MSLPQKVLTVVILLQTVTTICQCEDTGVTCDAPAVKRGAPGQLTCHFPVRFTSSLGLVSVSVEHYPDPDKVESDNVLDCFWDGKLWCDWVRPGYSYSDILGKKVLVILIAQVTEQHGGKYACHMIQRGTETVTEPCLLRFHSADASSALPPTSTKVMTGVPDSDAASAVPPASTNVKTGVHDTSSDENLSGAALAGIIAGCVVGVVVLVVLVVAAVFVLKRHRKWPEKPSEITWNTEIRHHKPPEKSSAIMWYTATRLNGESGSNNVDDCKVDTVHVRVCAAAADSGEDVTAPFIPTNDGQVDNGNNSVYAAASDSDEGVTKPFIPTNKGQVDDGNNRSQKPDENPLENTVKQRVKQFEERTSTTPSHGKEPTMSWDRQEKATPYPKLDHM